LRLPTNPLTPNPLTALACLTVLLDQEEGGVDIVVIVPSDTSLVNPLRHLYPAVWRGWRQSPLNTNDDDLREGGTWTLSRSHVGLEVTDWGSAGGSNKSIGEDTIGSRSAGRNDGRIQCRGERRSQGKGESRSQIGEYGKQVQTVTWSGFWARM